jgi:sialic acid synthase SpsE
VLFRSCIEDDVSLILSLGGQDFSFFENLYNKVAKLGINTTFLHTVSIYPTPIGRSNIAFLLKMSNKILHPFIKIGYSGHETGFAPSILSVLYGATMIERHFTLSDDLKIHHIRTALNPSYFRLMTQVIKDFVFEYNSDSRDIDPEEFIFLKDKIYK